MKIMKSHDEPTQRLQVHRVEAPTKTMYFCWFGVLAFLLRWDGVLLLVFVLVHVYSYIQATKPIKPNKQMQPYRSTNERNTYILMHPCFALSWADGPCVFVCVCNAYWADCPLCACVRMCIALLGGWPLCVCLCV